jgi:hypothetical protein
LEDHESTGTRLSGEKSMAGMAIHGWEESEVLPFCIVVMRSHFDTMSSQTATAA